MTKRYTQGPCPCGVSSDAFTTYEDGSYHCFSCDSRDIPKEYHREKQEGKIVVPQQKEKQEDDQEVKRIWVAGKEEAFVSRNISENTVSRYGARLLRDAVGNPEAFLFPYPDEDNSICGFKTKSVAQYNGRSKYSFRGARKDEGLLFGMNLFPAGGRYVTITEGELDAMSCYEMLKSTKVPDPVCLSLKNGANSVSIFKHPTVYKFLNSFDNIILCFDSDSQGKKALENAVSILGNKKVKSVKMEKTRKDANQYLMDYQQADFIHRWWRAEQYKPKSILSFGQAWEKAKARKAVRSYPYPYDGLNKMLYGLRTEEVVTITAQTGVGKTQVIREFAKHFYENTDLSIGILSLEETPASASEGLVSTFISSPIHLPDTIYDEAHAEEIAKSIDQSKRIYYYDDFGSNEIDNVIEKIEFFVRALGCKIIFLDHISMIVSDQRHGDERKALDEIATKLKQSTVELDYNLHQIAHLNRDGEIRGTANIEKLSHAVINLDRNLEADSVQERNTTRMIVRKNRFAGRTGPACSLLFDTQTYRMSEVEEVEEENNATPAA